eukprot:TRINITY_DN72777_c0_g1_i1.p1 TRINITY_DN72777_c0_g1~~TRINITY_DN72777_c0_g1_i1.p1  ORF type:complete len:260 (-),score=46.31 TRINITY_DN72777_c0_g1_i1:81-860(-)
MGKVAAGKNPASPSGGKGRSLSPKKGKKGGKEETVEERAIPVAHAKVPPAWVRAALEAHNKKRALHWSAPLVWSEECYSHAKLQVDACKKAGKKLAINYVDSLNGRHGQCIFLDKTASLKENLEGAEAAVAAWYAEKDRYDFEKPGPTRGTANFIQMIWAGSTSVGVAISDDGKFCVANYFPAASAENNGYENFVLPLEKQPAPWQAQTIKVPDEVLRAPCTEAAWQRHEELTELLRKGAAYVPDDRMNTELPELTGGF